MNPRKVKCRLLEELIRRIPWETALGDKGAQQSWQIFQDALHRKQELSIPRCKKSGKEGKRLAWLHWDLLVRLKGRRRCTGSRSRDRHPGKRTGILSGCSGTG